MVHIPKPQFAQQRIYVYKKLRQARKTYTVMTRHRGTERDEMTHVESKL